MTKDLSRRASQGGAITILAQIFKVILQMVNLVVMARLLLPSDFGLFAIALLFVGLSDTIRDFGLMQAAVRAPTLNHRQKSNLFWVNLSIGLALGLLLAAFARPLSLAFSEPRLELMLLVLALTMVLKGAQTQFQAQLNRDMRFSTLAWTDILANVVGMVAGVWGAVAGAGYWSLVIQQIILAITLLVMRVVISRWMPGLPTRRVEGMRDLYRFGGNLMLTQILIYSSNNLDTLLIGSKFSAASLGIYNRAYQLVSMPVGQIMGPLTNVALPVLARLRNQRSEFDRYFYGGYTLVSYAAGVVAGGAFVVAGPGVDLVFGPEWLQMVPIVQMLVLGAIFQTFAFPTYWIFLAEGRSDSHFRYSLVSRSVLALGVVVGSFWGIQGVAIGTAIGQLVAWPLVFFWLQRLGFIHALKAIYIGACVLAVVFPSILFTVSISYFFNSTNVVTELVLSGMTYIILVSIVIFLFPRTRKDIALIARLLRTIRK